MLSLAIWLVFGQLATAGGTWLAGWCSWDSHGRWNLEGCLAGVLEASHGRWNLEGCLGGVPEIATGGRTMAVWVVFWG